VRADGSVLSGTWIFAIIISRLMRGYSGDKGSGAEGEREKQVPPLPRTLLSVIKLYRLRAFFASYPIHPAIVPQAVG
jgi:hypothetical protein